MVAFQIAINGKTYCESEEITALTMVAEERPRRDGCRISLHACAGEGSVQWLAADLKVGDEIVVRIVEAAELEDAGPAGCSYCGRSIHDALHLVQGPSTAICDRCIADFSAALKNGTALPLGGSIRDEPEWLCGFCAKRADEIPGVVVRNGAAVCPECLRGCADLVGGETSTW
jgi:hypothetical protein